ncbi:MAG: AI-2E family transporter [Methylobacteriaceae bacterium]|nr:AI-2E family transporter [Methylobacteriaceae bacterium]MBV9704591.1 AI-2E family transporter [Methylobacteriaceae bacterium]
MDQVNIEPRAASDPTRFQGIARAALVFVLALLGLWTVRGFLPAMVWAVILAVAVWPLYQRALRHASPARHGVLLPTVFTLGVALIFVAPLLLAAIQFGREANELYQWYQTAQATGLPAPSWIAGLSIGGWHAADWWRDNLAHPPPLSELLKWIGRGSLLDVTKQFGSLLIHRIVLFAFTLLTLFFLFRHGNSLSRTLLVASERTFGPRGESLGRQMIASVHGTVDGLVLVGLGEGLLLGIAYWVVGVPQPTVFGALTAVAAMIPFGAPIFFCLAALLLLGQGAIAAAIGLVVFGFLVVAVADHVVRPVLIGGATRLPFLWVLFGILGGVETWGLLGLFLGPAVMAALILLWRELTDEAAPPG